MAIKTTTTLPVPPTSYEVEQDIALKEGAQPLTSIRALIRINHEIAIELNRVTGWIKSLNLEADDIAYVRASRITVKLHPGIDMNGNSKDRHTDVANGKLPDLSKPLPEVRTGGTRETLDKSYERLGRLYRSAAEYGDYIDAALRLEHNIPDDVETYTLRSVTGASNYIITSVPDYDIDIAWLSA